MQTIRVISISRRILAVFWFIASSSLISTQAQNVIIDPAESRIDVAVGATVDSFVGQLEKYKTKIVLNEGTATPREASMHWDFADLNTGKVKRDKAMLDWLEHDKTPQGSFVMKKWETRERKTWATGELAFHGVTNSISMPVAITRDAGSVRIQGEAETDYRQHKLKIIRMLLVLTVEPKVKVSFDLKGRLEAAKP